MPCTRNSNWEARVKGIHPFKGKELKTPNIVEWFIVYVALMVLLVYSLFPQGQASPGAQLLVLIASALLSAVLLTAIKTYLMIETLRFF